SMDAKTSSLASFRLQRWFTVFLAIACVLLPQVANAAGCDRRPHRNGQGSTRRRRERRTTRVRRSPMSTRLAWIASSAARCRWLRPNIGKTGRDSIGWTDVGGQYRADTRTLADGRSVPVFVLVNSPAARRFLVTNPASYSLKYNGLVLAAEKRMANRWQAFGSYTFSRATGLQAASGTTPGGAQVSTIALSPGIFGRDPNDLTHARGRLPNDRPHMFRIMGTVEVPRTGLMIATNFQYYSGKPWAATAQLTPPQGSQRIALEPRGARRLSSQSLLDLRVSRTIVSGGLGRIELLLDVLNVAKITAAEELASDNRFASNFGRPSIFTDPRRAMVGVRFKLGGK